LKKLDSILYFDLNIGGNYLSNWNASLALREIIANALDEQGKRDIKVNMTDDGIIVIKDFGSGLKPEHFICQEFDKSNRDDKIGKFGVGLKDAIGVLWSKNITVEIKSRGYEFTFKMKEKNDCGSFKTLHACIREIEAGGFIGTEFRIHNCSRPDYEEARQQFTKFQELKILSTSNKGEIIDKDISETASIYVHGMKISEDKKLRFSYNITRPSNKIKKGINRERQYVSRSVYQSDIVEIIVKVNSTDVLDILVEQLERTFDNKNLAELSWKGPIIKICNYIIKKNNTLFVSNDNIEKDIVFVTNDDIEKNTETYNSIVQNRGIRKIKVSPKVKRTLEDNLPSIEGTKFFIEHYTIGSEQTISLEELTDSERDNLNSVIKLLKSILKSDYYLLDKIWISEQVSAYTNEIKGVIIIPRDCLQSIESCSSKLINALASLNDGGNHFKDYIIGELCSEFLQKNTTSIKKNK